jgi:hypothetical protein
MAERDFSRPFIIGYGSSPSRHGPAGGEAVRRDTRSLGFLNTENLRTFQVVRPRPTRRARAMTRPPCVAFRSVNSVGVHNKCLSGLDGWAVRPYGGFGPALTDKPARLGFDAVRYSFIVVDFQHLLPAGLPAHLTEHFCTGVAMAQSLPAIHRESGWVSRWQKVSSCSKVRYTIVM